MTEIAFRLEPIAADPTLLTGLQMAVADPAWMLSRQSQFGEMTAENAGSPASAQLWLETSKLSVLVPRVGMNLGASLSLNSAPLEAQIENECEPRAGAASPQLAALAGQQFRRELVTALAHPPPGPGNPVKSYWEALLAKYPLKPAAGPLGSLAAGRVPDGCRLYADLHTALRNGALPDDPQVQDPDTITLITTAARRFLAWYDVASGAELGEARAWSAARMEYQVMVGDGDLQLTSQEYDSGRLDWYAFDVQRAATPGTRTVSTRTFVPAPVTFQGMPTARLWEFEDAAVNLGAVRAGPEDLAAMLVIEFALRYGNDFFLVPLPLRVGAVSRVGALVITDTFGVRTVIRSLAELNDDNLRVFEHEVPPGQPREPAMVVFPTAPDGPESPPFEDVVFARDEGANICWAIEKLALGASGLPEDRAQQAAAADDDAPAKGAGDGLRYRPATSVAAHWYPLLPKSDEPTTLRLTGTDENRPWGRVLESLDDADLPIEEVSRDGRRVTRVWRYARGTDGVPYVWAGRRAGPAFETGSSGLRFDLAEPAPDRGVARYGHGRYGSARFAPSID
jgi:hypothetical protein